MTFRHLRFFLLGLFTLLAVSGSWTGLSAQTEVFDLEQLRTKLLTHLIRQQMIVNHFSHKTLDDSLSEAAFDLYVQQLDVQKRFLLTSDLEQLRRYRDTIDDAITSGQLELPKVGARLLRLRVGAVTEMVPQILSKGFDFRRSEFLETDPEKIDFVNDEAALRERWRLILKYQVLMHYLQLLEERDRLPVSAGKVQAADIDRELLAEAVQKVRHSTQHLLDRLYEQSDEEHFERFINAFLRAYDPHSAYLAPDALEDFEIYMKGSLEGIGATLREEDGYIKVVEIIPGSPASRQRQLGAEDIILKVGEEDKEPVDVTQTRLRDAVRLIRGKKGTRVHLTVRKPTGSEQSIVITRDVVEIEEGFARSTTLPVPGQPGKSFGYLRIPAFYRDFEGAREGRQARNVTDDVRQELAALNQQHITGLVLDLRNNGGGALEDAIHIAGLFVSTGPVVQVKNHDGEMRLYSDDDPGIAYRGPLVVLVNRFSASASEILAGAIQDYGRGVIVGGEGTHGKGTVQAIFDMDQPLAYSPLKNLEPLGALKVTVQKFYRINGGSTQVKGVEPDIQLPDRLAFLHSGEKYIEHALPWDTVAAVPFQHWAKSPDVEQLRDLSHQRVVNGHLFDLLVAETQRNLEQSRATRRPLQLEEAVRQLLAREDITTDKRDHGVAEDQGVAADWPMKLRAEIRDDPYVEEALAVLGDMEQQFSGLENNLAGP